MRKLATDLNRFKITWQVLQCEESSQGERNLTRLRDKSLAVPEVIIGRAYF